MRPALVVGVGLAAASAAFAAGGAPTGQAVDLAVTDVAVVDVVEGRILEHRTVLVDGGRIASISPADEGGAPDAERVLDGSGRYLVPGLHDAHVHFRGGDSLAAANRALLPLYVANGVTTVRGAGGDITGAVLEWREAIEAGELVGPRILTSGPKLDGPRPSWPGSIALASPSDVPAALDSLEALGVDYVKIYDGSTPADVYLAIVAEAERRGMRVTGHMPLSVRFLDAVRAGLDATEHLYYAFKAASPAAEEVTRAVRGGELGFWDAMYAVLEAPRDPERAERVYRSMARHGTAVVPTLHIGDVLARVELTDHSADPELAYIDDAVERTWRGRVRSARRASPETRRRYRELRDAMAAMVEPMHDAGVTVLAGSDAGPFNSFTYPGFALHSELEALVEAGLTPVEALRAATTAPAAFMGLGDVVGRVAEGYVADLVLLDDDPLQDIRHTRTVSAVVLDGRTVLERDDLRRLLESARR